MVFMNLEEVKDLFIVSLILAVIFSVPSFRGFIFYFSLAIISLVPRIWVAKFFASKMEGKAIFKLNVPGSIAGIIFSIFGIRLSPVFNIESYGYKFGRWNRKYLWFTWKEKGAIIALETVTTLLIASIFLLFDVKSGAIMNAWIAMSVLLPFKNLEGETLLKWNFGVWSFFFVLSLLAVVLWI